MYDDDEIAYGDLYQWGRFSDGHQCRDSKTIAEFSDTDQPEHGLYILASNPPILDWRSPQNSSLWQEPGITNNPCPEGFRLPTELEWEEERLSWNSNDFDGAFESPLKLPSGGYRISYQGDLNFVNQRGYYWSSSVTVTGSRGFRFQNFDAFMGTYGRAGGLTVRCIKD